MLDLQHDADTSARVEAAKLRVAFRSAPASISAGMAAVVLIVLAISYVGPGWRFVFSGQVLLWAAVLLVALAADLIDAIRFNRQERSGLASQRPAWRNLVGVCIVSALWGSASWLLVPAPTVEQDAILYTGLAITLMGGANALGVCRPMVLSYSLPMAVVFAAGLLRLGDPMHVLVAFAYLTYGVLLVMNARKQEDAFTSTMLLSIRNEELLAHRTQLQQAAERSQADAESARSRAEAADRAKTGFIAAASHDLRQPMHALVQYVAHLRRTSGDPLCGPTIDKIDDSIAAMEDLLNAVLDFSKFSMGSVTPNIEAVNVAQLLASIETQMLPLAQAKGLDLVVQSRAGFVRSDEVLLERVLRNIVHNAVRYTAGGKVVVRAVARGELTRFLVSDSGIGISRSESGRIFDEYYQVDNRARDRRKGLGLGLAIVRNLAELLQVRVRLRSAVGRGSTFVVEVPTAPAPRAAMRSLPDGAARDHVRGALVLLIDDDPMVRDGVTMTLKDFGCRVLAVASGSQALRALEHTEFPPQIIVSDYRLEAGCTGLDAIDMVVAHQSALGGESFRLPAILISGDTSPDELKRVSAAGYPMLHKPVSPERLYAALNGLLGDLASVGRP